MNDLFGGVVYAGIDTDRYKYPIGSGRVTFGNQKSFMKAVKAGFVEIKTGKFSKKVRRDSMAIILQTNCCWIISYVVSSGPNWPISWGLSLHHVQSSGGAILLSRLQMLQVLLPHVLAVAALHWRLPRPQASDKDLQVNQKLLNDVVHKRKMFGSIVQRSQQLTVVHADFFCSLSSWRAMDPTH